MSMAMTLPFAAAADAAPAGLEDHHAIEQFLFAEAALLDERRFAEWGALLADDIRYYAPTRYNRLPRERAREWGGEREAAHFDDDKAFMAIRIKRLGTDRAWSEDPPSRTRHFVGNVRARALDDVSFEVDSNMLVYRARSDDEQQWFVGSRHDLLRRAGNAHGFEIARRTILFDHTAILANNLGIFF